MQPQTSSAASAATLPSTRVRPSSAAPSTHAARRSGASETMSAELKRSTEPKRSPSRPEDAGVKGAAPGTGRLVGLAKTTGLFLIVAAVVILIWQLLTAGYDDGGLAPTPAASWHRLIEVVSTAFVFRPPNDVGIVFHLIASLRRVLIGFGLAALIAIPLGLVLGSSRTLESALDPIVQV